MLILSRSDATAGFSDAHLEAATKLIWPIIAEEVKTVGEWVSGFKAAGERGGSGEKL